MLRAERLELALGYFVNIDRPPGGKPRELWREEAKDAINLALELMGKGEKVIGITDPNGATFAPAEFDRLFVESKVNARRS